MKPITIGRAVPRMYPDCTFVRDLNPERMCGQRSTWHLLTTDLDDAGKPLCLASCDDHLDIARSLSIDVHATSPVCDVPGTVWVRAADDTPSHCEWTAATALDAEATEHEGVNA